MIRRFGDGPMDGQRYVRRHGVYALLPRQGDLLVTCQSDPAPDLQLPGGGIDPGESPLSALYREVFEETGWSIARPRRLGVFRRFAYMPDYDLWAEKICTIYLAHPARRLNAPSDPNHSALWLPAMDASHVLGNPGDRHYAGLFAGRIDAERPTDSVTIARMSTK